MTKNELYSEAMAFASATESAVKYIPTDKLDAYKLLISDWTEEEASKKGFDKDACRVYNDIVYKALDSIEKGHPEWTPENAPSLWTKCLTSPNEILPWEQPDSTNGYKFGDKTTHNGKIWESTYEGLNVWEPGVFGWKEVI